MIKVNLLPTKRKKKAKPVPTFLVTGILLTLISGIVMAYLVFFFNSRLSDRKAQVEANEKTIAELKQQIKEVEDFERRNKTFQDRNAIIEQLSKNKSLPVKLLDEMSTVLPTGIWLTGMSVGAKDVNISGYGFTNDEIVTYVNNMKSSPLFTEVYLQESKSTEQNKVPLYFFRMTFKVQA
jgi:type IV pilus assembly protein PilN